MSVVAHTSIGNEHMASVQLNSEPAVTSISVSARIEYIQRFSKQAVLVIENDVNAYTQAARQFLTNFSSEQTIQETNVAFISASTKLNDIQMRCRLIEQLFSNTLFDPEKSLAVSILNLNKQSKNNINIVIEHAHALSLQIKYELCQLVDVANKTKTKNKINVVLFGIEQAAQDVATNKSIFKNKLSIIEAKSGQLFSIEHSRFAADKRNFTRKLWVKILATVVIISMFTGLSWYGLIHYDNFKLSNLSSIDPTPVSSESLVASTAALKETVLAKEVNEAVIAEAAPELLADSSDIQAALLGEPVSTHNEVIQQAKAADVLQALNLNETPAPVKTDVAIQNTVVTPSTVNIAEPNPAKINIVKLSEKVLNQEPVTPRQSSVPTSTFTTTPDYYLNNSTGYVVQLVGFTNKDLLSRFVDKYPNLEYFSYEKKLNDQKLIVLTTAIFNDKPQAKAAIQKLPQGIIDRGVWVKSLSIVQEEINSL